MLQVIGLIIAAYAMVRLLQVPLEMTATQERWFGLPFDARVVVVGLLSGAGVLAIAVLTLILLASGSRPGPQDL